MNDELPPTNAETSLLEARLSRAIIGALYRVHDELGFGFLESVYRRALASELSRRGLVLECERVVEVWYRGVRVGHFRVDLMVEGRVLVEIKTAKMLGEADRKQLLNYLRATDIEVGLLLNFGPRATFLRLVYSNTNKPARPE